MIPRSAFVIRGQLALVCVCACAPSRAPVASSGDDAPRPTASSASAPPPAPASQPAEAEASDEDPFAALDDADTAMPSIPACFELRGKDDCVGSGAVMLACSALGSLLTEAPRERFVGCLQALNGTERLCSSSVLRACALPAIEPAPVASGVAATCADIVPRCPPPESIRDVYTTRWCEAALSSLNDASRDELMKCMRDRCDVTLCASQLW